MKIGDKVIILAEGQLQGFEGYIIDENVKGWLGDDYDFMVAEKPSDNDNLPRGFNRDELKLCS